jgi:hypothetical protein
VKEPQCVGDILYDLDELAEKDDVCIADVVEAFGNRSYGPLLLVPALLEITPVGAIPGVPTFLAVTIAIVAVQMLIGRSHVWLPGFIRKRSVSAEKLREASDKLRKPGKLLDRWFGKRLKTFTGKTAQRVAAVIIIALCISVPPLEVLPFASSGPMLAIACFGLAIMVRDGLLMLIAGAIALGAFGLGLNLWGSGGSG